MAAAFEAIDLDVHRDRIVAASADPAALLPMLASVRQYTSIDRRTADAVRGSFLFAAVFRLMQRWSVDSGDGAETVTDACSQILANCSGDVTQDRCPAYVTLPSKNRFLLHHGDFVTSGTAWRVWDGAIVLSSWIVENPSSFTNKDVLELGSGTGLCGLAAAASTARRVTLSDADESVARTLRRTISDNVAEGSVPEGVADAVVLHWGGADVGAFGLFDVIVASDVVYDGETLAGVVRVVAAVLRPGPSSRLFCCCGAIRQCVDGLVGAMAAAGLRCVREVRPGHSLLRQSIPAGGQETVFFEFSW